MWDVPVITDRTILANWPDTVLHDKKEKTCLLLDIAVPDDSNINTRETEKLSKYKHLEIKISRMWKVRTKIVPVSCCDFDRALSLICGNKMPTRCNRGFYCRSYCLLNMFCHHYAHHQELKSITQWLLRVVFCAVFFFQVAGLVWSW